METGAGRDAVKRKDPELPDGRFQTGEESRVGAVVERLHPADVGGERQAVPAGKDEGDASNDDTSVTLL